MAVPAIFPGSEPLPGSRGQPFTGFVRFEGVLHVDDWATVDPEQLGNPRNVANGLGRRMSAEQAEYLTTHPFSEYRYHAILSGVDAMTFCMTDTRPSCGTDEQKDIVARRLATVALVRAEQRSCE